MTRRSEHMSRMMMTMKVFQQKPLAQKSSESSRRTMRRMTMMLKTKEKKKANRL
jgi:hypothetical protein